MARKSRKNTESVTAPVQESTFYATAIYVRLSIENSGKDYDGDSIANQISFCKNYLAEQTDLKLCDIYQDNGEKETNFDRLEFKRMMDMTALLLMIPLKNMINDVYAKDISRKIITSFRARQEKGEFLPAFVPVPKSRLEKADAAEDDLNDVVWATLRKLLEMNRCSQRCIQILMLHIIGYIDRLIRSSLFCRDPHLCIDFCFL